MEPRKIIIEPAVNGLIVRVGCTRVVFEGKEKCIEWIIKYMDDPACTEELFIKSYKIWKDDGKVQLNAPTCEPPDAPEEVRSEERA